MVDRYLLQKFGVSEKTGFANGQTDAVAPNGAENEQNVPNVPVYYKPFHQKVSYMLTNLKCIVTVYISFNI